MTKWMVLLVLASVPAKAADSDYVWLYQKIFSADVQRSEPSRAWKSFKTHLRDNYRRFPDTSTISITNLKPPGRQVGSITYVEIFPRQYRYDVFEYRPKTRLIQVRVHFKNPIQDDVETFGVRFQRAQEL